MDNALTRLIKKHKKVLTGILLLLLGCLYYFPRFVMEGIPHYLNEDTYMHLNRMVGMRNVWKSPVSFLNFAHNGPPVNIFYPWLPMYPMYLFYRLTGSYVLAYKLYYLVLTLITLYLAYDVMKKISGNSFSALLFSVMYTFSAYRFINVFRRAHLGESICMTAMLPVLFGLYSIAFGDRKHWPALAVGMAVIAYSHNIFLLIASLTVGLFFLISVRFWNERKERILSLGKAALAAAVFSLGSLIPILQYMLSDRLYTPGGSGEGLEATAFSLKQIVEKSLRNEPVSYAAGFLVLAALVWLLLFYCFCVFGKWRAERNKGADCSALLGIIIFFSATSLLPWKQIGDHTPLFFIQFVWRLNSQSTIFILAAFCYYFPKTLRSRLAKILAAALITAAAAVLHFSAVMTLHKEENTRISEAEIALGNAVTFDYAPLEAKEYRSLYGYSLDDVLINGEPGPAEIFWSEDGTVYTAVIDGSDFADSQLSADIPVFRYSTQKCLLDGEDIPAHMSDRGTTLVELQPGKQNVITIFYEHTKLTLFSWLISFAAFALFTGFCISRKRNSQK